MLGPSLPHKGDFGDGLSVALPSCSRMASRHVQAYTTSSRGTRRQSITDREFPKRGNGRGSEEPLLCGTRPALLPEPGHGIHRMLQWTMSPTELELTRLLRGAARARPDRHQHHPQGQPTVMMHTSGADLHLSPLLRRSTQRRQPPPDFVYALRATPAPVEWVRERCPLGIDALRPRSSFGS